MKQHHIRIPSCLYNHSHTYVDTFSQTNQSFQYTRTGRFTVILLICTAFRKFVTSTVNTTGMRNDVRQSFSAKTVQPPPRGILKEGENGEGEQVANIHQLKLFPNNNKYSQKVCYVSLSVCRPAPTPSPNVQI